MEGLDKKGHLPTWQRTHSRTHQGWMRRPRTWQPIFAHCHHQRMRKPAEKSGMSCEVCEFSLSLSLSHTHTHTHSHIRTPKNYSKMMVYSRCRQEMIPMSIASRASDSFVYHSCGVPIQQTDQVVNWHYSVRPNQIALKDGGISAPRRSLIWVYNVRKARFFHTRWAHAHSGKILLGTVVVNLKEIDIVPKGLFSPHATKNYFVCIDASFYKKNVFVKNRYATFQVSFNV